MDGIMSAQAEDSVPEEPTQSTTPHLTRRRRDPRTNHAIGGSDW